MNIIRDEDMFGLAMMEKCKWLRSRLTKDGVNTSQKTEQQMWRDIQEADK